MSHRSLENTIREIQLASSQIQENIQEETAPFDGGKPVPKVRKDQYGNVIKDKNVAKNLAKQGMASVKEEDDLEEGAVKRKMEDDAESMSKADFIKKHGKDASEFWEDMNEAVQDKDEDGLSAHKNALNGADKSEDEPLPSKKKKKEAGDSEEVDEVAGAKDCWDGYKKDGTKPGTGENKGKRVNNCVEEETDLEEAATDFFKVSKDILKLKDSVDQKYINKIGKLFGDIASNSSLQKRDKSVLAIKKAMRGMDTDSRDAINDVLDAHNLRKGPNLVVDHVEMDEAKRKFEPSAPSASAAERRKAIEKHQAKRGKKDDYDMDDDKPKTKRVKGKYGTSHYDESVSVDRVNESSDNRFSRLLSNAIKKKS